MCTRTGVLALAAAFVLSTSIASACPFCSVQGQTLSGEVAQADFILYGTLTNAKPAATDSFGGGSTDLNIESVIKGHDFVKDKKVVTLPRYVPPAAGGPTKFLIFFYYNDGKLDPYRGEAVKADSKLPDYLKGAIDVKNKDSLTRLRYFFDYLESPDLVISSDAYVEFGYADYKDVRPLAEKLPADTLLKWLKDPNTRASRFGLYGLMIGHCGKPENAADLRKLLEDPDRAYSSGLDGMFAGYTLLDPKAGWEYILAFVKDPKKDFAARYAALKTVRFFWEYRPDVVTHAQSLDAIRLLLAQADIADLPVEDLRKWGVWELTDEVLALAGKESHNVIPIVNRAILKFALSAAPHNKNAVAFVEAARAKDAKKVEFLEELIRDEQKPAVAATPPKS
jgi:hypothetical protein